MNHVKTNYFMIDALKLFFSICIVALHTHLFMDEFPTLYWYCSHVIWRLAVPFFFVTSGYFYSLKIKTSDDAYKASKTSIKRLLILFCFWLMISLPLQIEALTSQNYTLAEVASDLVKHLFFYPWGALWYLLALIIAYVLIFPFLKRNCYKLPLLLGGFLYLFALLANSYYFLIENTVLQNVIDNYREIFISARNGVFTGFFFVAVGNYLTVKKSFSRKQNYLLLGIGLLGLCLEAYLIRNQHYTDDHSLFVSLLLAVPALFESAKSFTASQSSKKLRNLSIGIYVLHRPVLGYLDYFFGLSTHISSISLFTVVLIISLFLAYLLQSRDNKYINRIIT